MWEFTHYGKGKGHYRAEYTLRSPGTANVAVRGKSATYRLDVPLLSENIKPTDRLWMTHWRISFWDRVTGNRYDDRGAPTLAEAKEACRVHAVTGEWNGAPVDVSVLVGGAS